MANKIHVKTGDKVVIISGKDKGKQGKVLEVSPKEGKIIIEGCNLVTKHVKPRADGRAGRHREGRSPHVCLQGNARLPQMRQTHPRSPQGECGRDQRAPVQVRRNFLRRRIRHGSSERLL